MHRLRLFVLASIVWAVSTHVTPPAYAQTPTPQPFTLDMTPANTAFTVNPPGSASFWNGKGFFSIFIGTINFLVSYGQGADGKPKIEVPNFEKEGNLLKGLFFGERDGEGGPLTPLSLKVGLPQKRPGNTQQYQVAFNPCANASDKRDESPQDVAASQDYDEHTIDAITGLAIGSSIWGTNIDTNGKSVAAPSLTIDTPTNKIYTDTNGSFTVKPDFLKFLFPCDAQNIGRNVSQQPYDIINPGAIAAGIAHFEKSIHPDSTLGELLSGLGKCIANLDACIEAAHQDLGLQLGGTVAAPGYLTLNALAQGDIKPEELRQAKVDENTVQKIASGKGWANAFFAKSTKDALGGSFNQRHGTVTQTLAAETDKGGTGLQPQQIAYGGAKGTKRVIEMVVCSVTPQFAQTGDCNPLNDLLTVPADLAALVDATNPHPEGILGIEFLQKYAANLVTQMLTPAQRTALLAQIQAIIDRYVKTGLWPNSQLGNPAKQAAIAAAAQKYKLNEAFVYALWIEETHGSSVGTFPFGCGHFTSFETSLNCLTTNATVQTYLTKKPFPEVMCMYADGNYPCTFQSHPHFVRNWSYYYDFLTMAK